MLGEESPAFLGRVDVEVRRLSFVESASRLDKLAIAGQPPDFWPLRYG